MPKINVDRIITMPKNAKEKVATCFYLIMTCPDIKKYEKECEGHVLEMIEQIGELPKSQWTSSHQLATDMALVEHTPFYQENLDWIKNYIDDVLNLSNQQIQELGGVH